MIEHYTRKILKKYAECRVKFFPLLPLLYNNRFIPVSRKKCAKMIEHYTRKKLKNLTECRVKFLPLVSSLVRWAISAGPPPPGAPFCAEEISKRIEQRCWNVVFVLLSWKILYTETLTDVQVHSYASPLQMAPFQYQSADTHPGSY
jgi:hypothetical protein